MKYSLDIFFPESKTIVRINKFNAPSNREAEILAVRLFKCFLYMVGNNIDDMGKYANQTISRLEIIRYSHGCKAEQTVRYLEIE